MKPNYAITGGKSLRQRLALLTAAAAIALFPAGSVFAASSFDTADLDKGLIHVTSNDGGKLKVIVEKDGKKYIYDQNSAGKKETFPLQLGNGAYKVSVMQNTSGNTYKLLASKEVTLNLADPNRVYLNSIQNVAWGVDSKAVAKAAEVTRNAKSPEEKARVLWDYMVKNNKYDYNKLNSLSPDYLPRIDQTLAEKKGICYDFSSLYAAMMRSQGTPVKLVKGYAPKNAEGYHAWNEVYDAAQKKWLVVDTTYDLQVYPTNAKVNMNKNSADFSKVYEY